MNLMPPEPGWQRAATQRRVQGALFLSTSAFANVKLINKDSKSHDILIKCSSSADSSIGDSSTRDLGKGPCTVTVKKTGSSASGSGSDTLTIKDGKVSK